MKILISGVKGFIGKNLINHLKQHDLTGLGRNEELINYWRFWWLDTLKEKKSITGFNGSICYVSDGDNRCNRCGEEVRSSVNKAGLEICEL